MRRGLDNDYKIKLCRTSGAPFTSKLPISRVDRSPGVYQRPSPPLGGPCFFAVVWAATRQRRSARPKTYYRRTRPGGAGAFTADWAVAGNESVAARHRAAVARPGGAANFSGEALRSGQPEFSPISHAGGIHRPVRPNGTGL